MTNGEMLDYITHGQEERNLEYKSDGCWSDQRFRSKLIKTILAMSNIQHGGILIIGVTENDEVFSAIGIGDENALSYRQDDVSTVVNEYADPFVDVNVTRIKIDDKKFIIIEVAEFDSIPTLCKRDDQYGLRRGAIYVRPRRMNQSIEVPTQTDMREIIDLAVDKQLTKTWRRLNLINQNSQAGELGGEQFNNQLEGLV
ncbi:MAG: ATP-binding protein [Candidatus Cloacimonetes bacterium]|jgi:predicted HTH transcriptional regulator|nr:ATP-binding protein [Candidatus Cloacimonadota bacterium]